eukprot:scaffold17443_cov37-Prasinocladus_malaysianus.AAC.1
MIAAVPATWDSLPTSCHRGVTAPQGRAVALPRPTRIYECAIRRCLIGNGQPGGHEGQLGISAYTNGYYSN